MSRYKLEAKVRETIGKGGAQRRENRIPAVVYGAHIDSQAIEIPTNQVERFIRNQGTGSTLDLVVDGKTHLALFKALQIHPVNHRVLHMDFQALKADEKVKVTIPVNIHVGEHVKGMMVQELLNEIEIFALPGDLESVVSVVVEEAAIGDTVLVSDLEIAKNDKIEILTDLETPVYNVVELRAAEEATEEGVEEVAEAAAEETAEEEATEE